MTPQVLSFHSDTEKEKLTSPKCHQRLPEYEPGSGGYSEALDSIPRTKTNRMTEEMEAEELAHSIKCLLCKHEGMSLSPGIHIKSSNPHLNWRGGDGWVVSQSR